MSEFRSIWHDAADLAKDDAAEQSQAIVAELRSIGGHADGRFLTIIGSSSDPRLHMLTSYVEINRFGLQFGDSPKEMVKLYGDLGETICVLVIDKQSEEGIRPASASRLAIGHIDNLDHLPSIRAIKPDANEGEEFYEEPVWHISEEDYRRGMEMLSVGSGVVFDGSTIASMPEYKNHSASLPIFSAYARMAKNNYKGFDGVFLSTIVERVAGIIGLVGGYNVLNIFPGTSPEIFYGAPNTAPHVGVIDYKQFSEDMTERVATHDLEVDKDGSTFVFI